MSIVVNGEPIGDETIRHEAAALKEHLRRDSPDSDELSLNLRTREWARENLIERVLLRQAALQDPAPVPAEALQLAVERYRAQNPQQAACMLPRDQEALRDTIELDLRIDRLLASASANVPAPKNGEIEACYRLNKQSFYAPEMVHAAHIVKNSGEESGEEALQEIRRIRALLDAGSSFEELADQYSDCPGRGGDLGFFARGEMVAEFEDVVFSLAAGQVSDIFRSPFGFHLAKVYARRPSRTKPFKEVRGEIERLIWNERKHQAVRRFIDGLRSAADVRKGSAKGNEAV